jgi:hypothetical protein
MDVIRYLTIFGIVRMARQQINQVVLHRLHDAGAGFGWGAFWVQQMFQVKQPLALAARAFNLLCKR